MTVHRFHPDPERGDPEVEFDFPVLFDDCDRCKEHAVRPWGSLDARHLTRLREIIYGDVPALTKIERLAARTLSGSMTSCDDPQTMIVVEWRKVRVECSSCGTEIALGSEVDSWDELVAARDEHQETGL